MAMLYRRFGRTELPLSVLSAGCMRSMQSWEDISADHFDKNQQHNLEAVLQEALQLGINHIETARGYGSSERQLGKILPKLQRDNFFLQTKIAPEDDPDTFTANALDSLARLGVDFVDLLACHGINSYRELWQSCRPGGCLAAARRLQRQGKARWIGLSGHGSSDILLAAVQHEGDGGFDYINLHWYTIFQQNTVVLKAAQQRDMGIFIISPNDKGGMLYQPPALLEQLSAPLAPMQFNDLFCLRQPEIHTISVGAAKPEDFHTHVEALAHITQPELVSSIFQRWQKTMFASTGQQLPDEHWQRFPAYSQTPGYMNLPYIFWLHHLATGWDMHLYAKNRYARLGQDIRWVPGNNTAQAASLDLEKAAAQAGLGKEQLSEQLMRAHTLLTQQ